MSKRITIVLDDEIVKKLRKRQAKMIHDQMQSVSFSAVINEYLKKVV